MRRPLHAGDGIVAIPRQCASGHCNARRRPALRGLRGTADGIASPSHDAFAALLQALVAKGELDVPDVAIASVQFFTLIKGEVHARMTCGLCSQPGPLDRRRHIDATVDMFLRAYGRR